jgi:threonine dehydratase
MPSDAPALKIQNTQTLGAEVILYDRAREVREEIAAAVQKRTDAILVPPFEDPLVIAGQGTVGLECVSQLAAAGDAADVLVCPTSGGGLMAGSAIAFSALSPGTRLFAVEPEGFDDTARSLRTGRRVSNPATSGSLCDALLTPQPGALTFAINQPRLTGAAAVSDEEALEAVSFAFRHLKLVLEPGGAVGLAAVLRRRVAVSGGCVLIIASGGNVDPAVFARAILPRPSN